MASYARAPQIAEIASDLIEKVDDHKPLAGVPIFYVWRDTASKSKGRLVLAKARKVSGLNAFLSNITAGLPDVDANDSMFVVEVAADTWGRLTHDQQVALVDHELCHLQVDEDGDGRPVLSLRGHDLEEFAAIVERHGLWASDVAAFGSAVAEQLALAVDQVSDFLEGLDGEA
jgi:predicted metallopeptidase